MIKFDLFWPVLFSTRFLYENQTRASFRYNILTNVIVSLKDTITLSVDLIKPFKATTLATYIGHKFKSCIDLVVNIGDVFD